ncbi:ribonuclease E [Actinopolyspora alba]|uniref:Ribonuclease E n=1 Tax=Actinopolyspora alba TaxID=673379 RepID=A0A1I1UCT4_9ACTN|nr:translation initiation factor IF-2 N-terminal domain-containing protein [Actinopolyspora alba]SFD68652.1 ribonuclease E [Actinopolyspora alba]
MLNRETSAGNSSGSSATSEQQERAQGESAHRTFEMPAKLRVHALAKMLGATSREVIATLGELGESVRSAQSNITRDVALNVVRSLRPDRIHSESEGKSEQQATDDRVTTSDTGGGHSAGGSGSRQSSASEARSATGTSTRDQGAATDSGEDAAVKSGTASDEVRTGSDSGSDGDAATGDGTSDNSALAPAFAAPQAMFLAPSETSSSSRSESAETATEAVAETEESPSESDGTPSDEEQSESVATRRRRRRGRRGRGRGRGGEGDSESSADSEGSGSESGAEAETAVEPDNVEKSSRGPKKEKKNKKDKKDKSAEGENKSNGQRGGGSRGSGSEEPAETSAREAERSDAVDEDTDSGGGAGSKRRRRRRRKSSGESENVTSRDDDPPNTVVHVRETAPDNSRQDAEDEVRSVKGSTRLEAKRQRRRDGREAGRKRAPVLSESEFLARRESVDRKMVVRENEGQTQVAVLEDDVLVENFVTSSGSGSLVGNVYLGRVQNVLPSMEAAFVDIGRGRNAVLYAGEVDWESAGLAGKSRRIEQALSTGDSVLVQVTKDPLGHKGARLTTQISLPGRFLVYVPGGGATGISRKLPDNERKRLKDILKRIVPEDSGVIIRTASEGTSEQALDRDVRRLQAQWEDIRDKAESSGAQAPQLLYAEPDLLIKVVRDLFTEDFSSLAVQGGQAWETIEAYVKHVAPDLLTRLSKHVGTKDVFTEYRIDEQISKALDRKVWLPSGGYLVVDRTEAMTVIDVNTGKFTGSGGNLEETVTRNNLEAAEEIVRQLRLRDIGGIIVIDFIDMVLEANRDLVLRRLTECLGRDRTRHQVAEVTSLGLVQMTRKRVGTGLLEAYSSTCEHCRGRGVLVSTEPIDHSQHVTAASGSRRGKQRNKSGQQAESTGEVTESARAETPAVESETTRADGENGSDSRSRRRQRRQNGSGNADQAVRRTTEPTKDVVAEQPAKSAANGSAHSEESSADPEASAAPVAQRTAAVEPAAAAEPAAGGKHGAAVATSDEAAQHETEPAQRGRRKASRPTGITGTAPQPVVLDPAERTAGNVSESADSTSSTAVSAGPVQRSSRRAAGRAAGPPAAAGADSESE